MDPILDPTQPNDQQPEPIDKAVKKVHDEFRARIDSWKSYRKKLIPLWTQNIDYRRGKPFAAQADEDRINVNLDWSLTKAKQAALFSQIPQIHVDHPPETQQAGPWVSTYERRLNDTLILAGIESAMDECLPDCINAAGFGAVLCAHEAITEDVEVPSVDFNMMPPEIAQQVQQSGMMPDGQPIPMETVTRNLDQRYTVTRISPADLLLPLNFTGADFDNAPWVGRSGRMPWAEAVSVFNLKEEDKEKVCGGDDRGPTDRLTQDQEKNRASADEQVTFDEIFYKERPYNPKARSYSSLHHLVFVNGIETPVIDEPWKGQREDSGSGRLLGAQRYPIRILTLAYISDETIPPSDTAIGRPQVQEINKGRTQMILQRERSLPLRWFNVNGIDPTIQQSLMRGTWQGMIPVQGDGQRYVGEISRAQYPNEDFAFDRIAKDDLSESWQMGSNQQGQYDPSKKSATEANVVQQNFLARIGRERAKVGKFFVSIAEVLGGLLALYEEEGSFGEGFDPAISRTLNYSILADSTVLLDSNQRLERIIKFLNFSAKSGWVNIEPILKEIATLSGLDPNVVIKPPQPKPPVEPNISLRLTGVEDLLNPLTLATLMQTGQAPSAQLVEEAKKLIQLVVLPPMPPGPGQIPMEGGPGGPPPGPNGEGGPQQMPPQYNLQPGVAPSIAPHPGDAAQPPPPPVPQPGEANPQWQYNSSIQKRTEGTEG